jgi:hypothetical protein
MAFLSIRSMFSEKIEIDCRDGSRREVYNNVNDIYPLITKEHNGISQIADKAATELEGIAGEEQINNMKNIFLRYNERNKNAIVDLRQAYKKYKEKPCDEAEGYDRRIIAIVEKASDNSSQSTNNDLSLAMTREVQKSIYLVNRLRS